MTSTLGIRRAIIARTQSTLTVSRATNIVRRRYAEHPALYHGCDLENGDAATGDHCGGDPQPEYQPQYRRATGQPANNSAWRYGLRIADARHPPLDHVDGGSGR
jgi:hypothetical protein